MSKRSAYQWLTTAVDPPDLSRKPNRDRVAHALRWAKRLDSHTPTPVPSQTLENNLGMSRKNLGRWLRQKLLIIDRNYCTQTNDCRRYLLNEVGHKEVSTLLRSAQKSDRTHYVVPAQNGGAPHNQVLGLPVGVVSPPKAKRVLAELSSARFVYEERSSRLTHPLQSLPRKVKQSFWEQHGLPYDYDISSCAPTVLLQLAMRSGVPAILFDAITAYLADKHPIQSRVMALLEVDEVTAKRFVNGLFNGAGLACTTYCSAFREYGEPKVVRLQADPEITRLRRTISRMWSFIGRSEGPVRGAKKKSAVYRREERRILEVVRTWLEGQGVNYFLEHDGWRTSVKIDVAALEKRILERTGYSVTIK